jgi:hypothetical protein
LHGLKLSNISDPSSALNQKPLPRPPNDSSSVLANVNFSRKRLPASPLLPADENFTNGSKRQRHNGLPDSDNALGEASVPKDDSTIHGRTSSLSARLSKFKEESMHDKPSEKPPSVFMRVLRGATTSTPTFDQLMEDYHEPTETSMAPPPSRPSHDRTGLSGLTHHPNTSISSNATLALSTQSRDSSIFRFGRSVAFSMNPKHLWKKVTSSRDGKGHEEDNDSELVERQIRAEQAYAELKANGRLGNLGTHPPSVDHQIFTPGYTMQAPRASSQLHRDTEMANNQEASPATIRPQRVSATPGKGSISKRFHLRTSSFQELKKIASDATLQRRSSSNALSPQKERAASVEAATPELKSPKSKKDLAKAAKLQRRVSDLEAKLEFARRQLNETAADAPPVPQIHNARPRSRSAFRKFQPMPTLPSESLLVEPVNEQTTTAPAPSEASIASSSTAKSSMELVLPQQSSSTAPNHNNALFSLDAPVSKLASQPPEPNKSRIIKKRSNNSRRPPQSQDLLTQILTTSPPVIPPAQCQPIASHRNGSNKIDPSSKQKDVPLSSITASSLPPTQLNPPQVDSHNGLETVQEEPTPAILATPKATAAKQLSTPVSLSRPQGARLQRHSRTPSPVKNSTHRANEPVETRSQTAGSSRNGKLRKTKKWTRPNLEAEDAVWVQPDGVHVPPLPCQTSPATGVRPEKKDVTMKDDGFEWPEDVF